jgi:hypothetical protein
MTILQCRLREMRYNKRCQGSCKGDCAIGLRQDEREKGLKQCSLQQSLLLFLGTTLGDIPDASICSVRNSDSPVPASLRSGMMSLCWRHCRLTKERRRVDSLHPFPGKVPLGDVSLRTIK